MSPKILGPQYPYSFCQLFNSTLIQVVIWRDFCRCDKGPKWEDDLGRPDLNQANPLEAEFPPAGCSRGAGEMQGTWPGRKPLPASLLWNSWGGGWSKELWDVSRSWEPAGKQRAWPPQLQGTEFCQQPLISEEDSPAKPRMRNCGLGQYLDLSPVRPWAENPVTLCLDVWPSETMRSKIGIAWGHHVCGHLLCGNRTRI